MAQKVMVVTGSSQGIGFEIAQYFAVRNYTVYGLSRKTPENARFTTIPTDITQKEEVQNAFAHINQQETKIDYLINNAGKGMVGAIEDATQDEILSLFQLNLIACIYCMQEALPIMRKYKDGKIINISSIGSEMGLPFRGYYSASKSALDKVTEALRYEIEPFNIQTCALHLGDINTNIANSRVSSKVTMPYQSIFNKVFEGINSHVDTGASPEKIPVFIEKLIRQQKIRPHYYFGKFGQKASISLKKILPQRIFEKIIKKYAGL